MRTKRRLIQGSVLLVLFFGAVPSEATRAVFPSSAPSQGRTQQSEVDEEGIQRFQGIPEKLKEGKSGFFLTLVGSPRIYFLPRSQVSSALKKTIHRHLSQKKSLSIVVDYVRGKIIKIEAE